MLPAERVAIWPDGSWCALSEGRDFADMARERDDYYVVEVSEWEEDGSPAARYFQ